jgi:hypothetical protein
MPLSTTGAANRVPFTQWAAAGIYPFGDHVATYNNITLDYNLGDGTHSTPALRTSTAPPSALATT